MTNTERKRQWNQERMNEYYQLLDDVKIVLLHDALRIEGMTNKWLSEGPKQIGQIHFRTHALKEISLHTQYIKSQSKEALAEAIESHKEHMNIQTKWQASQSDVMLKSKNHLAKIKHYK